MKTYQSSLFDFAERQAKATPPATAKSRAGNPEASSEAAAEMNASGAAAGQCRRISQALAEIAANGLMSHKTPGEIAKFINQRDGGDFFDSVRISKRMSNLRDMGIAVTFGERTCEVQERKCGVWVFASACCGDPKNHATAPIGESGFITVQCTECGRGLGTRRAST